MISDFTIRDRRILTLMVFVAFVVGYGASQLSHTLPFSRSALGLTEGGMNWVFAATRLASLLGLLFMLFADRRGRRLPFLVAFGLMPIGNLLTAIAPNPITFTLAQSVTRIAVVAVAGLAIVILAEELSPQVRALGIGLYALAGASGSGIGLALLPIAERSDYSYRLLFAFTGIGLLALPILVRFLAESRAYVQYERNVTFRTALKAGLGRHFWPLAAIAFLIAVFSSPATAFVMERLVDDLEWETAPARFLLMVFSGLGTAGVIIGGRMADIIGRKRTTVAAMLLGAVGGVAFYTLDSGWVLAPAVFLATLGLGMLTPAIAAHRSELFPTRVRATAAGWITNVAIGGSITGFVIGALIVDDIGLPKTISALAGGLLIAMLLVTRLPETRGMDLVRSKADRSHATTPASQIEPTSSLPEPTTPQPDPNPVAAQPPAPLQ
ncbi:MAG: MFS transporter [Acidimicrobiia bacterium]|nr:MFS transporter [Acidimicrobiia bacterium]MDX2468930.1 MFS transporter [Acidimicrobiia bacterium]